MMFRRWVERVCMIWFESIVRRNWGDDVSSRALVCKIQLGTILIGGYDANRDDTNLLVSNENKSSSGRKLWPLPHMPHIRVYQITCSKLRFINMGT